MNEGHDKILAHELGKLGALGGGLGGLAPGAIGGYTGASFAARFLPTETIHETFAFPLPASQILAAGFQILSQFGSFAEPSSGDTSVPHFTAIVGSGFFRLNPTIVELSVV